VQDLNDGERDGTLKKCQRLAAGNKAMGDDRISQPLCRTEKKKRQNKDKNPEKKRRERHRGITASREQKKRALTLRVT